MARTFASAGQRFEGDVVSLADMDYLVAAWIKPTGDGIQSGADLGHILLQGSTSPDTRMVFRLLSSATFEIYQEYSDTDMTYRSAASTIVADTWQFVVGGHRASDNSGRLFWGDLDTPMTEVSYSVAQNGTSSFSFGGTRWVIGSNFGGGSVHGFDGAMSRVMFLSGTFPTVDFAERLRLGALDEVVRASASLPYLWPLDESAASADAVDLGPLNGGLPAQSSPGVAEDPPIEQGWINQ